MTEFTEAFYGKADNLDIDFSKIDMSKVPWGSPTISKQSLSQSLTSPPGDRVKDAGTPRDLGTPRRRSCANTPRGSHTPSFGTSAKSGSTDFKLTPKKKSGLWQGDEKNGSNSPLFRVRPAQSKSKNGVLKPDRQRSNSFSF